MEWRPWPRERRSASWRPTGATRCASRCGGSSCALGGAVLVALGAGRGGRAGHPQLDRPVAHHRRRRPAGQLAGQLGAYVSDALLLLFGIGAALLLPVVALAGLRMLRLEPAGRIGRGLLLAALGAVLLGIALGLTSGSAVSGLPGGWGGALGLAAAHGVDAAIGLIGNPSVDGPVRLTAAAPVRARRAGARLSRARPAAGREGAGLGGCSAATPRERARRRRARPSCATTAPAGRAARARARRSPSPSRAQAGRPGGARRRPRKRGAAEPRARRQLSRCRRSTCSPPPPDKGRDADRPRRARAQRAPARIACSRISTSAATSSRSAPARW